MPVAIYEESVARLCRRLERLSKGEQVAKVKLEETKKQQEIMS